MVGELLPQLAEAYNLDDAPSSRATAALSMGGGQSLFIGLRHLNLFGYVAGFSSATPDDHMEVHFESLLGDVKAANEQLGLLWIGCGKDDFLFDRNNAFSSWLDGHGIDHDYVVTEGGHTWPVWRKYLHEILPRLFRQANLKLPSVRR